MFCSVAAQNVALGQDTEPGTPICDGSMTLAGDQVRPVLVPNGTVLADAALARPVTGVGPMSATSAMTVAARLSDMKSPTVARARAARLTRPPPARSGVPGGGIRP